MVGRFNVRKGDSDHDWMIWDNAANGQRGSGLSEQEAHAQAAELELQYDAHGYRAADTVQRVDPPQPVERAWQPAGVLDAWVHEKGQWIGRIRSTDGQITWIPGAELRRAEQD
jgi:hypothetical protein